MKISFNIQSYKRAGEIETISILPFFFIWVHSFEADEYREIYGDCIREIPDEFQGNLPKVKNFIMEKRADDDVIVFLDDDISHFAYWENNERIRLTKDTFVSFVEKYSVIAKEWDVKLWGINTNNDKQVYREYTPFSTTSYISSSFSCFMKGNELKYDERFNLKEDYDMSIQQCNKYRKVLRVNKYYYMKKSVTNTGGCTMYRNIDKEKEQLALLQKKWGKEIVQSDSLKASKNHLTKKKRNFDINPLLHIPIKGV